MIDINYCSYRARFDDSGVEEVVFCFYPNGVWDEDRLFLFEAAKKYPRDKYRWVEIYCEEGVCIPVWKKLWKNVERG